MPFPLFLLPLLAAPAASAPALEVVSVERIWNQAPHSAFGDIIRFKDQWFVVFREGKWHVAKPGQEDDGKLHVIASKDGKSWTSAAEIASPGIDLRDPHLSVTADKRLMIVAGGSLYPNGKFQGRQSRVMFSKDGKNWTAPQAVNGPGQWLWRVTWHNGVAYGVNKYSSGPAEAEATVPTRQQRFIKSKDGVNWETVKELSVPGGDESTVRFLPDNRAIILMRRTAPGDDAAMIGVSAPPYKDWRWTKTQHFVGGPNFTVLSDGRLIAGGRWFVGGDRKQARTGIGIMTETSYEPLITLPSGGDNSYPGFVYHDGLLWTLYYSSHEGNTGIYLAKIRVR